MKQYKKIISIAFLCVSFALPLSASGDNQGMGVVNFKTCIENSKTGKESQKSLESMRKEMVQILGKTEATLSELSEKLNNEDYLDGLTPEAEKELKDQFRSINEQYNRDQNGYYQTLNQANMALLQKAQGSIAMASEKIAEKKGLKIVINEDMCSYITSDLDITSQVIAEMDKDFDENLPAKNNESEE